jgi:hypothetical protein
VQAVQNLKKIKSNFKGTVSGEKCQIRDEAEAAQEPDLCASWSKTETLNPILKGQSHEKFV